MSRSHIKLHDSNAAFRGVLACPQAYSRVAALLSEVGHQDVGSRLLETFLSAAPQSAEARNARLQLAELQATSRSSGMPDHYQVMGLPRSASSNDVCPPSALFAFSCIWFAIPALPSGKQDLNLAFIMSLMQSSLEMGATGVSALFLTPAIIIALFFWNFYHRLLFFLHLRSPVEGALCHGYATPSLGPPALPSSPFHGSCVCVREDAVCEGVVLPNILLLEVEWLRALTQMLSSCLVHCLGIIRGSPMCFLVNSFVKVVRSWTTPQP